MSEEVSREEVLEMVRQVVAKRQRPPSQSVQKVVVERVVEKTPQTVVIKADKVILQVENLVIEPNMTLNPEIHLTLPATKTRKVIERTPDGKLSAIVEEALEE